MKEKRGRDGLIARRVPNCREAGLQVNTKFLAESAWNFLPLDRIQIDEQLALRISNLGGANVGK